MIDTNLVEALARTLEGSPVTELVVTQDDLEIRFSRIPGEVVSAVSAAVPEQAVENAGPEERAIRSPRVGIYHKPQRPVHVGDRIGDGEIVGFIEAMRILNEVISSTSGVVTEVFVEDGSPVEYGEELFRLQDHGEGE